MNEYTEAQNKLLIWLEDRIKKEGSQNKFCKDVLNVSPAAISKLRQGTYQGDIEAMFKKIEEVYKRELKTETVYKEVKYADTYISGKIYELIENCHVKGGLIAASGDAGIGKTKAIEKYHEDHPNSSIVITVNPCISSIKSLLTEIAENAGATVYKSKSELWKSIVSSLPDGMVIIFDEAQHLSAQTIDALRSIPDYFIKSGKTLGMAFIGNIEIMKELKRAEFAQIDNRSKQTRNYSVKNIKRSDIEKIFPILSEGFEQEIDFLLKVSHTRQSIRGAVNLFSNAYDNENYTLPGLIAMAEFMGITI